MITGDLGDWMDEPMVPYRKHKELIDLFNAQAQRLELEVEMRRRLEAKVRLMTQALALRQLTDRRKVAR